MAKKKVNLKVLSENELRKKFGNSNIATVLIDEDSLLWLPSKCLPLNNTLGGGIPYGRVVELFGYESTGKTLLAMDFCQVAQQLGGVVLWADFENAFTNYWAESNGLDPTKIELLQENSIELMADWSMHTCLHYRSKLVNNEPIILVVDSIAAGETEFNLNVNNSEGKAEMGNRAKAWDKFYRTRINFFKRYGIIVIMINQVRGNIGAGMFEPSETTPGGKATKFYASLRIELGKSKQIKGVIDSDGKFKDKKDGGKKMGQNINLRTIKNKVAPPQNTLKTECYFVKDIWGYVGFSKYKGLDQMLIDQGIIEKRGSRFYYKDKMIANGEDSFIYEIHNRKKMRSSLISKLDVNTISKTRAKMSEATSNLFPIKE